MNLHPLVRAALFPDVDPSARDEYTEASLVSVVRQCKRDDLGFFVEAAQAGQSN